MPAHRPNRSTEPLEVLDRLPDDEREVLILSSFYGLAKDEIACIVGASVHFVEARLEHAQEHLRVLLNSRWTASRAA